MLFFLKNWKIIGIGIATILIVVLTLVQNYRYNNLKIENQELTERVENYEIAVKNCESRIEISDKKCNNEITELKKLISQPKVIYKDKIIVKDCEIKVNDNNNSIVDYLNSIGF